MDNTAVNSNTGLSQNRGSATVSSSAALTCNTFTDVHEPVVAAQNQNKQEEAENTAGLPQSFQDNKAAKAARLQAQAETAQKLQAKYREDIAGLAIINPATGSAVEGVEELFTVLREQRANQAELSVAPEQVEEQMEGNTEKASLSSPEQCKLQKLQTENTVLRRMAHERQFAEDLSKIKELNPNESAQTIFDLGETFFTLRRNGIELQTAYQASRAEAFRNTLPAPAAIGAVNGNPLREKDFYTPAEVDRLTDKDFKRNPKLLEKVQKSMRLW